MHHYLKALGLGCVVALAAAGPVGATPAPQPPTASVTSPKLAQAWRDYLSTLEEMRKDLESTSRFHDNPEDRAKAFHMLMEMQAMAYNFVIQPRLESPRLFRNISWATNIYSVGQNGPDTDYRMAFLDGSQVYRLRGRVGDTKLTIIQTFNGIFGEPGFKTLGSYDLSKMDIAKDGSFDIVLGGPPLDRNWIALDPKVRFGFVLIRRILTDWDKDLGEMTLAKVSPPRPEMFRAEEFCESEMADRIVRAAQMIRFLNGQFTVTLYRNYLNATGGKTNSFSLRPGYTDNQVGNPESRYAASIFDLKEDEALVVRMPKAPQGVYWSFHTGDVWSRSLDFFERQSALNNDQADIAPDGSLTLVLSQKDPGVVNWMDPVGRRKGILYMRNYRSGEDPVLTAQVVKFADLNKYLPKEMKRISLDERAQTLARRRASYIRHYGE